MATQIIDTGVSLKIVNNNKPRFVLKTNIISVEVLVNTTIKIDIGEGTLYNIYVDQALVTSPVSSDVNDLRDQIHAMLQASAGAGNPATEAKQIEQTAELTNVKNAIINTQNNQLTQTGELQNIKNSLLELRGSVNSVNDKLFYEVRRMDETNGNVVYKGYANPGTASEASTWAILRITNNDGQFTYHWAEGNRNFDKSWDTRYSYQYF
jgi:hypothetical protein